MYEELARVIDILCHDQKQEPFPLDDDALQWDYASKYFNLVLLTVTSPSKKKEEKNPQNIAGLIIHTFV